MARKKKSEQDGPVSAEELANQRLAPIRAWAHANHGAIAKLTTRIRELSGEDLTRTTVARWLHKDATKRQQPRYGFGLHLEAAYQDVATS